MGSACLVGFFGPVGQPMLQISKTLGEIGAKQFEEIANDVKNAGTLIAKSSRAIANGTGLTAEAVVPAAEAAAEAAVVPAAVVPAAVVPAEAEAVVPKAEGGTRKRRKHSKPSKRTKTQKK